MRIPPSVFVMSLVTAVPFGLAVRDTLHPHKTRAEIAADNEQQYELDMQKQEAADRQAEEQRKATVMKGLLGDKGKLGAYFDGIAIGAPVAQAEAIHDRTLNTADIVTFEYDAGSDGMVKSLRLESGGDSCAELGTAIHAAWGPQTEWLDEPAHTRVHFDETECTLAFDRYVDLEHFVDKTLTASIPVAALGKTLDQIPGLDEDDHLAAPGLVNTGAQVDVRFTTDDAGKIVGVSASFSADADADATIRARLDKLFGKGKLDADTSEWDWKGKPPVHYALTAGHAYLDIGQP